MQICCKNHSPKNILLINVQRLYQNRAFYFTGFYIIRYTTIKNNSGLFVVTEI